MERAFLRNFDELKRIVAFTEAFFRETGIDRSLRNAVDVCVEEIFVNMVTYNRETQEDILIEMKPRDQGIEVSLTDRNVERFDPREARPVDVNAPLDERTPGGLGLYLVMKMTNAIHYEYRNRTSKITFVMDGQVPDV